MQLGEDTCTQYRHASWNQWVGVGFLVVFAIPCINMGLIELRRSNSLLFALPPFVIAFLCIVGAVAEILLIKNKVITVIGSHIEFVTWLGRSRKYTIQDVVEVRPLTWLRHAGEEPLVVIVMKDGWRTYISPYGQGYGELIGVLRK